MTSESKVEKSTLSTPPSLDNIALLPYFPPQCDNTVILCYCGHGMCIDCTQTMIYFVKLRNKKEGTKCQGILIIEQSSHT